MALSAPFGMTANGLEMKTLIFPGGAGGIEGGGRPQNAGDEPFEESVLSPSTPPLLNLCRFQRGGSC